MKCPTCGRRVGESDRNCKRCSTDLTALLQIREAHGRLVDIGFERLALEYPHEAQDCFRKALHLKKDSEAAKKGMALSSMMQGAYKEAIGWYFRYKNTPTTES